MNRQALLERYIELCLRALESNARVLSLLRSRGVSDPPLFKRYRIGYADGSVSELIGNQHELEEQVEKTGLEKLKRRLTIPIHDTAGAIVNIAGYSPWPKTKERLCALNSGGVFNAQHLAHETSVVFVDDPLDALALLQHGVSTATFLFGDDMKFVAFCREHGIKNATFLCGGHARLFQDLSSAGVGTDRIELDVEELRSGGFDPEVLRADSGDEDGNMQEIEGGFLFRFPLLSYRILGNFSERTMHLRVNVKAFTEEEAFVDAIDLYKHRNRQNLIYNLMDRFSIRDQVGLEQDLSRIVELIEEHQERNAKSSERIKPELTDEERETGMKMLASRDLIDEIAADYDELGYVQERKNKLLLYLVMTSRLMENPLHAIIISRSGAGKSRLAEVTEELCPPEDAESVSDLSANALYYFGENDLKHKFIVIGEKTGSDGSEYPLRELISRRSITKAIPMKDQGTGQVRTVTITVNGPISLVETTTSSNVNPENLNRCFVLGIDESEEQTRRIHELQRRNFTTHGFMCRRSLEAIRSKHRIAQRMLEPVRVFNPYAELLTFPSGTLRSRRDNEKFLRLIAVICFLHQFQREQKELQVSECETVSYIECSVEDYRIAHELLSDGVLDNTLDDLPQQARKLLETIRRYVAKRAQAEEIVPEKVIFERKDIREFSSWSFAQVRNNFRILQDYEYISCIKAQNGLANRYRINTGYGDLDYMRAILSPESLEKLINSSNPNRVNTPG